MIDALLIIVAVIDFSYLIILIFGSLPYDKIEIKKLGKVSVIIAAREGKIVENTLKSLKKVKSPKLEIIVVTNSKETADIARKYTNKVLMDKGIGKGAALNSAVKKTTCKILYFLDEDNTVMADTVIKVCSALNGNEVSIGYNRPHNNRNFAQRVAGLYICTLMKMQYCGYKLAGTTLVPARNFAIYKSTLKKLGGFRNVLTEDVELSTRIFKANKKVKFVNAIGFEQMPSRFNWYVKQQQRWLVGAYESINKDKKDFSRIGLFSLYLILFIAFLAPLSLLSIILAIALGRVLILSIAIVGFIICASSLHRFNKDDLHMLPVTFCIFIVLQTYSIIYAVVKKPKEWYRTPKE